MKFKEISETLFREKFHDDQGNIGSEFWVKPPEDGAVPYSPVFHAKEETPLAYIVLCPDMRRRYYVRVRQVKRTSKRSPVTESFTECIEIWDHHLKACLGSPLSWTPKEGGIQGKALKGILTKIHKRIELRGDDSVGIPEYWSVFLNTRPIWPKFYINNYDLQTINRYFNNIVAHVRSQQRPEKAESSADREFEKRFRNQNP